MRLRRISVVAVAVFLALAVGCGGKSSASPTTVQSSSGAGASPAEGTQLFTSSSKRYAVEYPVGWKAQENGLAIAGIQADVFLAPAIDGFAPNVSIICESKAAGMTADAYLSANLDTFKKLNINAKTGNDVQLGKGKGKLITYSATSLNQKLDYAQVFSTDAGCGWVLTLTTPSGRRAQFMDGFLNMAKTFTPQ